MDLITPWKIAQVLAVAVIGVYTYRKDMLNAAGAFSAFLMGALIVLFTNILWLFLLFALLGMGSAATRFRFKEKEEAKVSEKQGGRRSTRNVIANGLAPAILAVSAPLVAANWGTDVAAVAYVSAIAVAAADTFASEFGSLAKDVYLITTFRKVPAGVDGGVSLPGTIAALAGGIVMSLLGALLLGVLTGVLQLPLQMHITWWTLAVPAAMGFLGCQVDSILGATLEGEGLFTKEETNLVSIAVGGVLGFVLAFFLV
ncbi:MAG TPA: DUF92 domain-containing protein [Candidatus Thermoplasmatota archaeon]|nr:DUF92 domain-containing protein [Candidatus Thermoplasmatota archaeon]